MLHFGEKDHGIPMSRRREGQEAARPDVKIYTYHADHGFSCDERGSFDKPSHEKALERTLAFFKEHVRVRARSPSPCLAISPSPPSGRRGESREASAS